MRLEGKTALITGVKAASVAASRSDWPARGPMWSSITSVTRTRPARRSAEIEAMGRRGLILRDKSISKVNEVRRLIDELPRRWIAMIILINNAGVEKQAPVRGGLGTKTSTWSLTSISRERSSSGSGVRPIPHPVEASGEDHQYQLRARGDSLPGLCVDRASKGGVRLLMRDLAVEMSRARHHGQ